MRWQRRTYRTAGCALLALVLLPPATASAEDSTLPGASSDEHLWSVVDHDPRQPGVDLYHHGLDAGGPVAQSMAELPQAPERMAAWGRDLWLVFGARAGGEREVYRLSVRRDPLSGVDAPVPADRLDVATPLPGHGVLVGFVGSAAGPLALIASDRSAPTAAPQIGTGLMLLAFRKNRWLELPLPDGPSLGPPCALAVAGDDGGLVFIVGTGASGPVLLTQDRDGEWAHASAPVEILETTRVGAQVAVIQATGADGLSVSYLRPSRILPLATMERPAWPWALLGLRDGLRLVTSEASDGLFLRRIDGVTGGLGPRERMTAPPLDVPNLLRTPALMTVGVLSLLLVALFRPAAKEATVLPAGTRPLPLVPRLIAFAMDMVAGGVPVLLVLRCPPGRLLGLPFMTPTFEDSIPYLLMGALAIVHGTASELFFGRTLGKAVVGARLASVDGEKIGARQVLLRNLVKCLMVLVPPLGVIAMLNPNGQGLDDLVGRTVVVGPVEGSDRGEDDG